MISLRILLPGLTALLVSSLAPTAGAQRLQAGDRLAVRIFGGEQLVADTVLVSESGTVVLPKLGVTSVAGFDAPTLPDSLRARYAKYYRNPTVEVVVLRRVIVLGEVKRPDIYYVDVLTTLPDVIAHAGGLTENASSKKVFLRRGTESQELPGWETSSAAVGTLRSGDQIFVGKKSWLSQNILPAVSTLAVLATVLISLKR